MRDTVDPDFASYVDARQGRWLRSAYLVYGDPARAEAELLHAFSRLSLVWGREDDPDMFVQRVLYQPALSRWNRASVFEGDDELARSALGGMSPVQRTVFVLLYYEELTEFEIADLLSLSHTAVHSHGQAALSRFRSGLGHGDWRSAGDRR
ncbi:RNA polymerase, sigma-24 subunit, ECF subfamily [Kribbella flavida DSM 17836]|uniref:RNA polymerase, sigma-24 subunit, ECF subfamily n=1 Tax=Kribbella flavida (strain DSM 17836 / JCM 10339 / NBRC 14399) TaxID=479435 RepID=D2Q0K1_KRIFD|nr:sigma factor-like helix-turn-helix DNA-binding protein [Kribbella flavida]ADB33801.1 RNA polymerase, sigma-24 subunit, ECF subfamily [Kribbella flavida DSM 17836]